MKNKTRTVTLSHEFPKDLQHQSGRTMMTAAYLLEYWAKKGVIPRYDGVIDSLREEASEIFWKAKPSSKQTERNHD